MTEQRLRELYDAAYDLDSEGDIDPAAALVALADEAIRTLPLLLDIVEMARAVVPVVTDDAASAADLQRLRVSLRRFDTMPETADEQ